MRINRLLLPKLAIAEVVGCGASELLRQGPHLPSLGILPASLVSQVAVGNVNSSRRVYRGLGYSLLLEWVGSRLY